MLKLKPGTRRLDDASKGHIASEISQFASLAVMLRHGTGGMAQDPAIVEMLQAASPEVKALRDHFVAFLEDGLARER
jgi:hypothetical protein